MSSGGLECVNDDRRILRYSRVITVTSSLHTSFGVGVLVLTYRLTVVVRRYEKIGSTIITFQQDYEVCMQLLNQNGIQGWKKRENPDVYSVTIFIIWPTVYANTFVVNSALHQP